MTRELRHTPPSGRVCPCQEGEASVVGGLRLGLVRCPRCGLLSRLDMPSEESVSRSYRDDYWSQYRDEQAGPARDNVYAHAWTWLERVKPSPGMLVDVGCGAGSMLALCGKRGWKGIGFDLSTQAVDYARARGIEAYVEGFPPCRLADESVDAVSFVNVLDHLPGPFEALREAWRILRPGGVLYIRVPNGPFHVGVLQVLSRIGLGHLAVFHLHGFGRTAFLHHLPRLGFEIVAMQSAPPSQGYAYGQGGPVTFRTLLKTTDYLVYCLLRNLGLAGRCWGPSIEVIARKGTVGGRRAAGGGGMQG